MSDGMVGQAAPAAAPSPPPAPLSGATKSAPVQQAAPPAQPTPAVKAVQTPQSAAAPGMPEQLSTAELDKMLHKVNLTFDLFEIEADASVDPNSHELHVVVRNTRTGDVIRRIPAYEFQAQFVSFKTGVGMLIDRFL